MEDIININWYQYKKITRCPLCWAEWLHVCPWRDYKTETIYTNNKKRCMWEGIPESFPWSWIKIGLLVCDCETCRPKFIDNWFVLNNNENIPTYSKDTTTKIKAYTD